MVVMMEYMKDTIPKSDHRLFKAEFLNRSWDLEQNRIAIFKQLRKAGAPSHKAYQESKRRMKI